MSDIFISYAKNDFTMAQGVVRLLKKQGWSVWWDRDLRMGENLDKRVDKALNESHCVIVLWTIRSVRSQKVREQAAKALKKNKLIPVLLEVVRLPELFRDIQATNLTNWDGEDFTPSVQRLLSYIRAFLEHLHGNFRDEIQPRMGEGIINVFISYASFDLVKVEKLVKELKLENDIEVWFDQEEIVPGDDFVEKMKKAISTCDKFLICLSPSFIKKSPVSWVRKEFKMAMLNANEKGRNIIIPIRIKRGGKVPDELGTIVYADLSTKKRWKQNYPRLLVAIRK